MIRTFLTVVVVSSLFVGFTTTKSPTNAANVSLQEATENIGFQWAFGALTGKEHKFVSITKDTVLKSGDEIKMFVQLTKDCFVYVIHSGSKGEIDLMFPNGFKQFTADYEVGKNYYVPKGRQWVELDKVTGRETFYVLGSTERLIDLEAKIGDYLSASDAAKKDNIAKDIVAEIRNVKKRFKSFATIAEKPLTIGGNVRSLEKAPEAKRPDVATIASQISANNFYSKTITIDHQ